MTRAAFLPSTGDPFIVLHTVRYFLDYWQDEVDALYVNIASIIDPEIVGQLTTLLEQQPKIRVSFTPQNLQHGDSIKQMLDRCTEDYILLIETDSIIFKKGIVDCYFKMLESGEYELIGSPRMSCHPHIAEVAKRRFGLDYSGYGDRGPAFWPCFLWVTKEALQQTDGDFNTHHWKPGEQLFGHTFAEDAIGDTLVWASLQLRELGLRILEIPQYHCLPGDFQNRQLHRDVFDGKCGYMHFGSLSSGIESYLLDDENIALKHRAHRPKVFSELKPPTSEGERVEMIRRISWWSKSVEQYFPNKEFTVLYRKALTKLQGVYKITDQEVLDWQTIYEGVINATD